MLHKEAILPRKGRDYTGGIVNWRTGLVHVAAMIAGLHVKVEGFPLGTTRNLENEQRNVSVGSVGSHSGI